MTREAQRKKDHFRLNRGLNTESNEISFPDGFSTDESNYELLVDGSRRRRKGLALESGGSSYASGITLSDVNGFNSFVWRGVGGDPDKNVVVHQMDNYLYMSDDAETVSTTFGTSYHLDMRAMKVNPTWVDVTSGREPCSFSRVGPHLLVTQKYMHPFYVSFDSATGQYTMTKIKLRVRDFEGIDDGVGEQVTPGSLSDDHQYNLRNRGWVQADISTYFTGQSVYPAKSQVWYKGYRRLVDVAYSDLDGIQTFDDAKLAAEQFGQSSAPQGGLFLDPLDTRYSASTTNEGAEAQISSFSYTSGDPFTGGTVRVVTASAHGRSTSDTVTIAGNSYNTSITVWITMTAVASLDGFYVVTVIDPTTFDITIPANNGLPSVGTTLTEGQVNGNVSLPKSDGTQLDIGPVASTYFAGRCWYAGIQDSQWSDTIMFSKLATKPQSYGTCYQEEDPTNPELNRLVATDGGTIIIPGLGNVKKMLPMRDALIVFSDQGVWEIGGGQRGAFTAGGYSVRKITESECSSEWSPIVLGNRAIYTGPRGVHVIAPNQFTSVLEEENLSADLINTLWNDIPYSRQERIQSVYDSALDRVYFLYNEDATTASNHHNVFNAVLVLDLRVGAFYRWRFNTASTGGLVHAYAITEADSSNSNKKIKWLARTTNSIDVCDLDQTNYVDFDGAESPLPFMVTGWDNIGDFQQRRQAPVVTVFAKRTETGYTSTGGGWDPVNESSNLLTAAWDWTDDSVSGKVGTQNETYRHTRGFVPSGIDDVDGYPVVVTRNKLRGRGRVLQLRFDGATGKDSHILGFTLNYKVSRGR
jgi:hypothetical protein